MTSARITPKSKEIAALKPFIAAVSSNTKNTGPSKKAKNKPRGIPAITSCNIQLSCIANVNFLIYFKDSRPSPAISLIEDLM